MVETLIVVGKKSAETGVRPILFYKIVGYSDFIFT